MLDPKQPLWMPKGSVRAVIALLIIIPVTVLALTSDIKMNADQFVGLVTMIIGAYFVQKAGVRGGDGS